MYIYDGKKIVVQFLFQMAVFCHFFLAIFYVKSRASVFLSWLFNGF